MNLIMTLDAGTTGVTASYFDENFKMIASESEDFAQFFPQPGWVEHDLNLIKRAFENCFKRLEKNRPSQAVIKAIGITNQRETICFWDKKTGTPLHRALVWQDRRTADRCEKLNRSKKAASIRKKTGLVIDPYFSASKIQWALKNMASISKASKEKRLAIGTIDTFLLAWLTGFQAYKTEPSNASRTLLFNVHTLKWDLELCKLFSVDAKILPEVVPSDSIFGVTVALPGVEAGIPITGILGDQQAALLGQSCVKQGMLKCTYGTGSFVLLNIGNRFKQSKYKLLTTIAWHLKGQKPVYALEGSAFVAGSAVQWARDQLKLVTTSREIEEMALKADPQSGVVFVPSLAGLSAPYWNANTRGVFFGITRKTSQQDLCKGILDGLALQMSDLFETLAKDSGQKLKSIRVDGGATENNLLMQLQADTSMITVERPKFIESTSLGAAKIAALGSGLKRDLGEIARSFELDRSFKPALSKKLRDSLIKRYRRAIAALEVFHNP